MKVRIMHPFPPPSLGVASATASRQASLQALTIAVIATILCAGLAWGQQSVLTQRGSVSRDGRFSSETYLTPSKLNTNQFGSLFSYGVDGYVIAEPLYVSSVNIPSVGV